MSEATNHWGTTSFSLHKQYMFVFNFFQNF